MKEDMETSVRYRISENFWLQKVEAAVFNPICPDKTEPGDISLKTFEQLRFSFPAALAASVNTITGGSDARTFLIFLTALNILAYKCTGNNDILVGTTTLRQNASQESEDVLIFFRTGLNEDSALRDLLNTARDDLNTANKYRQFDYESFLNRFNITNAGEKEALSALGLIFDPFNMESPKADEIQLLFRIEKNNPGFLLVVKYETPYYQREQAEQSGRFFMNILTSMLENLDKRVQDIDILSKEDRRKLLLDFSGETFDYSPGEKTFIPTFERQVEKTPLATAVTCEEKAVNYLQLNEISNQLAHLMLKESSIPREDLVIILMSRSEKMTASIIAAWKCGAAYVPIDTDYPDDRIKAIIEDSGSTLLITETGGIRPQLENALKPAVKIIYLDNTEERLDQENKTNLNIKALPSDLAYVIYTSGSTGKPKGVLVEHKGMMNHLYAKIADIQIDAESVIVQNSSQCFDISIWQFFAALLVGGRTVVYPNRLVLSPETFIKRVGSDGVKILEVVPSYLAMMLDTIEERKMENVFPKLKYLLVTGETVRPGLVKRWFDKFAGINMVNAYGPTEASDDITHFNMDRFPGTASIPIGRTVRNLRIYILDSRMNLCPPWVKGEICVSGMGVGRGYLNDIGKTTSRFVKDPFRGEAGVKMYKTGDIGRYLHSGNIEFFGRKDYQVKIRGFRIELEEIENKLSTMEGIGNAVVIVKEDKTNNVYLCAYITLTDDVGKKQEDIKRKLREVLPEYMIPSNIVIMESMPLTANGKVDRKALPEPGEADTNRIEYVAPGNAVEKKLAEIWQEVLGITNIGVNDSFFNLGGNSLLGIRIVNKIQEWLQETVHVTILFLAPTIKMLAEKLESYKIEKDTRIDAAKLEEIRGLIEPIPPLPSHITIPKTKKPRAMFILCPSRSGSTLLRIILDGHPKLFAPQELELLSFNTLQERKEALLGKLSLYLEGLLRAIMEIKKIDADEAKKIMEGFEARGMFTWQFYGILQKWLGDRILVEKTPQYTLDLEILKRTEDYFDSPLFIHLIRNPYAVIYSFENARLDQLFKYDTQFSSRELGELLWVISHQNILEFLEKIPAHRKYQIKYEKLVSDPGTVMAQMCNHFDLEYYSKMLQIYDDKENRMTDGIYAESKMLGDVKFFTHSSIDTKSVDKWKEKYKTEFLGDAAVKLMKFFGYLPESAGAPGIEPAAPKEHHKLSPSPVEKREYYNVSFGQKRVWLLCQSEESSLSFNMSGTYLFKEELNPSALNKVANSLIQRHESLRTVFLAIDGDVKQVVLSADEINFNVQYKDLRDVEDKVKAANDLSETENDTAFDLQKGPLLRVKLIQMQKKEYLLILTMHHIISDFLSMEILRKEFSQLYKSLKQEDKKTPGPLKIQYKDFAAWQIKQLQGGCLEPSREYWRSRFDDKIPVLELPYDGERPRIRSYKGGNVEFTISPHVVAKLRTIAGENNATLFMVLLAAVNVFLSFYTGQTDIIVGILASGREHTDLENQIGFYLNSLAPRTTFREEDSFSQLLEIVKKVTSEAYEHQMYPFDQLIDELRVKREPGRNPLFDVVVDMINLNQPVNSVNDLPAEPVETGENEESINNYKGRSKFDLTIYFFEKVKTITVMFEYNRDLFEPKTINRMARRYRKLLERITEDTATSISKLLMLEEEINIPAFGSFING